MQGIQLEVSAGGKPQPRKPNGAKIPSANSPFEDLTMTKQQVTKARPIKAAKPKTTPMSARSKAPTPIVDAPASCCPKCGSTERTDYSDTTRIAHNGIHNGREYSQVVWRTTACKMCGQRRRDRSYELRQC